MLDLAVEKLSYRDSRSGFVLNEVGLLFQKQTHTLLIGPGGGGKSTLLRLIAGELRSGHGTIRAGSRAIERLSQASRPLLYATADSDLPPRWSVQHVLIAAGRTRKLDREDRLREIELTAAKWELNSLLERRCRELSGTERARLQAARIELLRPAILLANRLLERVSPSHASELSDRLYRTLRIMGTTVVSEPAWMEEARHCDRMVVLAHGMLIQEGTPRSVYERPEDTAAGLATGEMNLLPINITNQTVDSAIGPWELSTPPFQGEGTAMVRPESFELVGPGEESDLIFGVEEAGFQSGRWHCRGFLSGGFVLQIVLPASADVHKGKLVPLRVDRDRIRLVAGSPLTTRRDLSPAIPSRSESR